MIEWLCVFSILQTHFRIIASIERTRISRYGKAGLPLLTRTYNPLIITLFEGISIKNELIYSIVSARVDDYETGILAELERLTMTVQKFLRTELKERMNGGQDVERRRLKFEKTHSLMSQQLQGVRNINWIRDRVAFEFRKFTNRLSANLVFGNNFQYWHDPVILARRETLSTTSESSLSKSIQKVDCGKRESSYRLL
jgi:hypothetical protein